MWPRVWLEGRGRAVQVAGWVAGWLEEEVAGGGGLEMEGRLGARETLGRSELEGGERLPRGLEDGGPW